MAKPTYFDEQFAERVNFVIDKLGGITDASKKTNVSIPSISRWRDGTSDPSRTNIVKLAEAAEVSLVWLATGVGESDGFTPAPKRHEKDEDYDYVPFYKAEASAGHGSFLDEHRQPTHHLAFRKRWITYHGFAIKDLVGLIAKGDSMEPTIQNNAAIIIDTSRNEAMDGNVYVIRMGDRLWVKRTQWLVNGLRLISDNDFYAPIDVTREQMQSEGVEVIGQIVHTAYDLVG